MFLFILAFLHAWTCYKGTYFSSAFLLPKVKLVKWTSKSVWRIHVAMVQPARTLWAVTSVAANRALVDATVKPTSMTASPVGFPVLCVCESKDKEKTGERKQNTFTKLESNPVPLDPCSNGGLCKDEVNGFLCTCPAGFRGTKCEEDINECESNPCKNGANCTDCVNSYTCTCPPGFSGIHCENNTPDCTERYRAHTAVQYHKSRRVHKIHKTHKTHGWTLVIVYTGRSVKASVQINRFNFIHLFMYTTFSCPLLPLLVEYWFTTSTAVQSSAACTLYCSLKCMTIFPHPHRWSSHVGKYVGHC